jgi:hypothetical protein
MMVAASPDARRHLFVFRARETRRPAYGSYGRRRMNKGTELPMFGAEGCKAPSIAWKKDSPREEGIDR